LAPTAFAVRESFSSIVRLQSSNGHKTT
jgi:hypothetical protein